MKTKNIFSKQGHGGNISEVIRQYGLSMNEIIDFSASINPLGYPPGLKEYIFLNFDRILHYPDIQNFGLIDSLSSYHNLEKSLIIVANGSTEIIHLLPYIFQGKKAIIISPAFSEYEKSLCVNDYDIKFIKAKESDDFIPDISGVLDCILNDPPDLLYIANPNSPAGSLIPLDKIEELLKGISGTRTRLILDEVFIDFVGEGASAKNFLTSYDNLLIIRSMTKFFGFPGLRLGYLLTSERMHKRIKHFFPPWSVGSIAQLAGPYSLKQKDYIKKTRKVVDREREILSHSIELLKDLRPFFSSANYILIKIEMQGVTALQLHDILLKDGIIIRDCSTFQDLGDKYFRVAVRLKDENTRLIMSLDKAIKKLK